MALHLTPGWIAKQPPEERIALARALLPAGYVVARDVGEQPVPAFVFAGHEWSKRAGWNACRAVMLGEATADDMPSIKAQILNRRAMLGEGE